MNTVENWNIGGGTSINVKELKVRNSIIVQAYKEGYSQQMIAKVLKITQQAVFAVSAAFVHMYNAMEHQLKEHELNYKKSKGIQAEYSRL